MSKVLDFLNKSGTFYLATCDGDQPKVRPLGMAFELDGEVTFGVGTFKDVYKQLEKNPKCEIVALGEKGHWLRYTGTAVLITDEAKAAAVVEASPFLKQIYNEQTGNKLGLFYLKDATAVDIPMMGPGEDLLA